jgi:hypothetical protein
MAARANSVGLCFIHGATLPDPDKVLKAEHKVRGRYRNCRLVPELPQTC